MNPAEVGWKPGPLLTLFSRTWLLLPYLSPFGLNSWALPCAASPGSGWVGAEGWDPSEQCILAPLSTHTWKRGQRAMTFLGFLSSLGSIC